MRLSWGFLADYSNLTGEGKLNVLGIFGAIWAQRFPCRHASLHLVLRFEADPTESGQNRHVMLRFDDPDGKLLFSAEADVVVPTGPPGGPVIMDQVLVIQQLIFPRPGDYVFHVLVDKDHKGRVPVKAGKIERPADDSEERTGAGQ